MWIWMWISMWMWDVDVDLDVDRDVDVDMDVLLLHIMPLSIFGVCACFTAGLAGSNDSVFVRILRKNLANTNN